MEDFIRTGIDRFVNNELEMKDQFDIFGAKSVFRALTESVVKNVVTGGRWFSFCTRISKDQYDIMSQKNNKGVKLGSFVCKMYPDTVYRSAIYKYLIRDYLCYYEAPTVVKDIGGSGFKDSYNKFLVTANLWVIAEWLGITYDEAVSTYGYRVDESFDDNECDMFPYVKLYETREGYRKVSRPRKDLDLGVAGTRVIPVYALKVGVDELYQACSKDFYDVDFFKDSGQERIINTTFDTSKIREVYGDTDFYRQGVERMYQGNFLENPNMERGYIRVFEVGGSKYDSPLRSINYARIVSFKKAEPDLTYINIDLNSVVSTFKIGVESCGAKMSDIVDMMKIFDVGRINEPDVKPINSIIELEGWVESQEIILSTVFLRQLALFMIGNPQWFDGYTGQAKESFPATAEALEDLEDFDDLDMSF